MLPEQKDLTLSPFWIRRKPRQNHTSRKLALAILLQALRDVVSPKPYTWDRSTNWTEDAREWIQSDDATPGSFRWICQVLEMDYTRLRNWVASYLDGNRIEQTQFSRRLNRLQIPHG
jgi:hypothetical protein